MSKKQLEIIVFFVFPICKKQKGILHQSRNSIPIINQITGRVRSVEFGRKWSDRVPLDYHSCYLFSKIKNDCNSYINARVI